MKNNFKLGFHYHVPAFQDDSGNIWMPGFLGCFIDSLATQVDLLVLFQHTPKPDEFSMMDYSIKSQNIILVDLGVHCSLLRRLFRLPKILLTFYSWKEELDFLLIRTPTPYMPFIPRIIKNLPLSLLVVGQKNANISLMYNQPKWKRYLLKFWAIWNTQEELKIAKSNLTFVNSQLLYDFFISRNIDKVIMVKTTTLSKTDFYYREDTCKNPQIHLLYTGRITRHKGLFTAIEALDLLVHNGENVFFDLVGWSDDNDTTIDEIKKIINLKKLENYFKFHGYKALGNELNSMYRSSDIFIMPSLGDSFPRVLWEAMANSLPIVSTDVGSIPDFTAGAAILVKPNDPISLANSIKKLIHSSNIRKELIIKGLDIARKNTIDYQTKFIISKIISKHQNQNSS